MPVITIDEGFTITGSLKEARKEAGLSQEEMAALLGVEQPYISRLETKLNQYLRILVDHKHETRAGTRVRGQ